MTESVWYRVVREVEGCRGEEDCGEDDAKMEVIPHFEEATLK